MSNTNTNTTTAVVVWNAETERKVAELINAGKSVSQDLVKVAPKGHITKLRAARRENLRASGHLILAQLENQNFKLDKFDGSYDPATKRLTANKVQKNGDEVIQITLRRRSETAEDKRIRELEAEKAELVATIKALQGK